MQTKFKPQAKRKRKRENIRFNENPTKKFVGFSAGKASRRWFHRALDGMRFGNRKERKTIRQVWLNHWIDTNWKRERRNNSSEYTRASTPISVEFNAKNFRTSQIKILNESKSNKLISNWIYLKLCFVKFSSWKQSQHSSLIYAREWMSWTSMLKRLPLAGEKGKAEGRFCVCFQMKK